MNKSNQRYGQWGLVKDMYQTLDNIAFPGSKELETFSAVTRQKTIILTGEGSSRIFPAKAAISRLQSQGHFHVVTASASETAQMKKNENTALMLLSNSGKTAEVLKLAQSLPPSISWGSLTALPESPLERLSSRHYTLPGGPESAVAATRSVIQQALFLDSILSPPEERLDIKSLRKEIAAVLNSTPDSHITKALLNAEKIYFAGPNNGAAEELALKCVEILRKPGIYLEGTLALHGYEEVMTGNDVLITLEPWPEYDEKTQNFLEKETGITVISISSRKTPFLQMPLPEAGERAPYLQLIAGWNLLTEAGITAGINIDKPERARKVGNEY